jgi:hypothetical protein
MQPPQLIENVRRAHLAARRLGAGCVPMTQSNGMRRLARVVWILALSCAAQSTEETLKVYTEHPRIFLRPARLKLLQRERERQSLRWRQFELLMAGKAPMPERGFAQALYYRIAGDRESGRQAVSWALGAGADLRQLALVYDWCQDLLSETQSRALAVKLQKGIEAGQRDSGVGGVRSRVLAAVALGDDQPRISVVLNWWERQIVPALKSGRDLIPRDDVYALFEILHALRDNLNIDLRDSAPAYFKSLPIYHLVSHYPATFPAPENEYRIPAARGMKEPDLRRAALSRAAELSMVAYDTNAPQSQVLQGWLMHDNFMLRGTFGITYEFLWANPYQPGLSYYLAPLVFHDETFGRLFARSSWEESATWLGYFDGELQLFQDGKVTILNPQLSEGPISLTEAVIYFGKNAQRFKALLRENEECFVLGLKPRQPYHVEVDDEEMREERTDTGGILPLALPHKVEVGVRLSEVKPR